MSNKPIAKIALFGTSADPPTIGHQAILRWLSQHYDRVVVWASDNPFKQDQTPLNQRTEMLELAIADIALEQNNIGLYPELSDRRTLITVDQARQKWGEEVEFTLVIGADLLPQINSWYRVKELLKQVKVLVVPRRGYTIQSQDLASVKELGANLAIASLNAPQVSSSNYRLEKNQNLITPAVEYYIFQNNIYDEIAKDHSSKH